jgi:hypothetical protein
MNLPDITQLSTEQVIELRAALDERLEQERQRIKQQAEAIDKAINGGRPRKKNRAGQHRNDNTD